MSTTDIQVWVGIIGTFLGGTIGILRYFNYRTKRDRIAAVGDAFTVTVEALASDNGTRRMAAAVLLRRFFDRETEQGSAGTPYQLTRSSRTTVEIAITAFARRAL